MTLDNLLSIHKLVRETPDKSGIARLLAAAERNLNDYEGDPVSDAALATCLDEAGNLLTLTRQWLTEEHPELAP